MRFVAEADGRTEATSASRRSRAWTARPTKAGSPGWSSRPDSRRGGCGRTRTGCGSSRSRSTGRRPGRSRPRSIRRSRRRSTPPRSALRSRSSSYLAEHATTRVGPRDRQVQVPVEQIEAAVIRHYTSRAGDPHRHLHLQINARVFAKGAWRGLHSVGVRDMIEAINGIGHAAVATDPEFRGGAREGRVHDGSRDRRDPAAGAVRRSVQRPHGADPRQRRAVRGRVAGRTSRRGARAHGCARCGIEWHGRRPARTRRCRRTAPRWSSGGTRNCVRSGTSTHTTPCR